EGWNVYFCNESAKPNWSQCTLSIGELFLQFLDYFAKFDWANQVVQIRQTNMMSKIERGWKEYMCIEDPFELIRNLGHIVTKAMFTSIINSFAVSYEVFSTFKERIQELEDCSDDCVARFGSSLFAKCRELAGEKMKKLEEEEQQLRREKDALFDEVLKKLNIIAEEKKRKVEEEKRKRREEEERNKKEKE
ncbi:hypothetical protein PMAYCL1PPCAC_27826, partial [Pristionchus mayeri]